jgi:hypothetical protein
MSGSRTGNSLSALIVAKIGPAARGRLLTTTTLREPHCLMHRRELRLCADIGEVWLLCDLHPTADTWDRLSPEPKNRRYAAAALLF